MAYRGLTAALWVILGIAAGAMPAHATPTDPATSATPIDFSACIAELQQRAKDQGRSNRVVEEVLASLEFQPRVVELDQRQPEFTETFANYLDARVTTMRVTMGRTLLLRYGNLLRELQQRYGVPPQYLLAFWGMETSYGGYLGKMPTLDSLATLACSPRRGDYFARELLTALELLEQEGLEPARMKGSWAGAMGHTQFMPSAYRRYAVDGDGDGRVDLWHSVPDALASAANFLREQGWQRDQRWGREVRLPDDFDYSEVRLDERRSLRKWRERGVTTAEGAALPATDMEAALLVPAGHAGPAFLVYDNFQVIMRWNRSQFYGLAVGHLADRINGAGRLQQPPPADLPRLTRPEVEALQKQLKQLGFPAGEPDGILGPATRQAIQAYQKHRGLVADGYPDAALFSALAREPTPLSAPEAGEDGP